MIYVLRGQCIVFNWVVLVDWIEPMGEVCSEFLKRWLLPVSIYHLLFAFGSSLYVTSALDGYFGCQVVVSSVKLTVFNVQKPTHINWDFYKQKLGPSIVNIFEQSVNSLEKEVPEYKDDVTADYQAKHQALMAKAAEQEEESKRKIVELEKEIKKVQEEKSALRTMTVDEYFAKHPQSKEKIDDEIRNQYWGY